MKKSNLSILILLSILVLVLVACGGGEEATPEAVTAEPEPTEVIVEETAEPTAVPTEEPVEEPTEESAEEMAELSNAEKAVAVLESLESGDATAVTTYVAESYIQHNLSAPTGRDAFVGLVGASAEAGNTVDVKRVLVDGDYVVTHTDYNFFGPNVGFDVFRFDENGIIVEHWDNLQANPGEPNPSGHTMVDSSTEVVDQELTEENRALVAGFVNEVLVNGNYDVLPNYFDGDNYIQHNPGVADGLSGFNEAVTALAGQGIFMVYETVEAVIADGNFVLVVSNGTFGDAPTSFYDLFRVEDGVIAEHWDVQETILAEDQWQNDNGKFNFPEDVQPATE